MEQQEAGWVLTSAPGVQLSEATLAAARAYGAREGLEVVDLVPAGLAVLDTLELADQMDPRTYRQDRLARGVGARQATLIRRGVLDRLEHLPGASEWRCLQPLAYAELMVELKAAACDTTDLVVVPDHAGYRPTWEQRRQLLDRRLGAPGFYGSATATVLILRMVGFCLGAVGLWLRPAFGLAAVAVYCAQPLIACAGTKMRPPDLASTSVLRWLLGPLGLVRLVLAARRSGVPGDQDMAERRRLYDTALAQGPDRFFEPRRDTCPWCGHDGLCQVLRTSDLYQHKPGTFTLDRCQACGHLFQNPRLSPAGLDFYYQDFYDGLGEAFMEAGFGTTKDSYRGRIAFMTRVAQPRRWLDVGAGHGHFCALARQAWPEATFEGLDLNDAIAKAVRRRWLDRAHQGLFPEMAASLAGRYDVVSMHHYLEHTGDPRAELDAAATVLTPGGHLLIEQPDPDYGLRGVLGSAWMCYLQPQHLHLVGLENLKVALKERGFVVVAEERGPAHQPNDLAGAAYLLFSHWTRPADLPWRPPSGALGRWWHQGLMTAMLPALVAGFVADRLIAVVARRAHHANAYRLIAQLHPGPA